MNSGGQLPAQGLEYERCLETVSRGWRHYCHCVASAAQLTQAPRILEAKPNRSIMLMLEVSYLSLRKERAQGYPLTECWLETWVLGGILQTFLIN